MPAFPLGRARLARLSKRSTSRSASTRPRSQTWATCSTCVLRVPWTPTALSRALPVRADCVAAIHSALTPVPGPHSSHAACPPFDSAGRVCVQPAAQLRHVQGHEHGRHVRSALRACPGPHSLESGPPRARRLRRRHPAPSRSRAVPLPTSHARLSTRQYALAFNQPLSFDTSSVTNMHNMFDYASAFNQPLSFDTSKVTDMALMFFVASAFNQPLSFDTSKVTSMGNMFTVRSARALAPTALSRALPVRAACVAATQRPHAPGPYRFPRRMPAFPLGRAHTRSTSRSASTPPASRTCTKCSAKRRRSTSR